MKTKITFIAAILLISMSVFAQRQVSRNRQATTEDDSLYYVFGGIVILGIIILVVKSNNSKEATSSKTKTDSKNEKITYRSDLIQDKDVTVNLVLDKLKSFKVQIIENRKYGFTEKDIHKQMEKYFKDIFQNVTMEQTVESKSGKAIDLDIGNGKVGIEVKLANEIFKEGNWDRVIGQIVKYSRIKYNSENLIIAAVGYNHELRNSALSDIEDDIISNKAKFCFISAGERNI